MWMTVSGVACGGHAATISELGHLLWPKLAAVYIERRLAPAVPHNEAGLDAFQSLAKAAERLEKEAAAMGCGLSSACSSCCHAALYVQHPEKPKVRRECRVCK